MKRNRINVWMKPRYPRKHGLKLTIAALVVSNVLALYMIVDLRAQVRGFDGMIQEKFDSAERVQGMEMAKCPTK